MRDEEQVAEWASELYLNHSRRLRDIGNLFVSFNPLQMQIVEDAVQNVFCLLIKKGNTLMEHPNIEGWLICTLRLKLREQFRAYKQDTKYSTFSFDDENEDAAINQAEMAYGQKDGLKILLDQEQLQRLEDLLGKENAELFYMYCVNGQPAKAVAQEFGISESAVWVRANRIRKKLMKNKELFLAFVFIILKSL
ncbi:MAG: sigma-70 family RNA polymerase sigma factor [Acinetobacter sp.]